MQRNISVSEPDPELKRHSLLTELKSYSIPHINCYRPVSSSEFNYLCHPSKCIFNLLQKCEISFRNCIGKLKFCNSPKTLILSAIQNNVNVNEYPKCHSLDQDILKRYIKLRLNIFAKELSRSYVPCMQYASKTAARSCMK